MQYGERATGPPLDRMSPRSYRDSRRRVVDRNSAEWEQKCLLGKLSSDEEPLSPENIAAIKGTGSLYDDNSFLGSTITNTLGAPSFEFQDFSLYPNPNNGSFAVKFTSASTNDIKINVHDMRGRQVYEKSFSNTGAFNQNINLDKVEAGVYLVTVSDGSSKTVKRIVVQ